MADDQSANYARRMKKAFERGAIDKQEAANTIVDLLTRMHDDHIHRSNSLLDELPLPVLNGVLEVASAKSPWPNVSRFEVFWENVRRRAEWNLSKGADASRPPSEEQRDE